MKANSIVKILGIITLVVIASSGCGKNNSNYNSVEYKPARISVTSHVIPYEVLKFERENNKNESIKQAELNDSQQQYKDKLEAYSKVETDIIKNNVTQIILEDTDGNVDWVVNENGDVLYNSIVFTDLYTNANMINSKYSSREIIDFVVHNFTITGNSKVVFSRLTDNNIISAEIDEDVHSTFLDRFYEIDSYRKFISDGNSDITWTLCIYEYGYTHLAEIHGNNDYIVSFSSKEQDSVTYKVRATKMENDTEIDYIEQSTEMEETLQ